MDETHVNTAAAITLFGQFSALGKVGMHRN